MTWFLLIVFAVLVLLAVFAVSAHNGLVQARNAYRNAFAQIDVQLQRRYELIPNLVETARASLAHERATLEAVMRARGEAISGLRA